MPVKKKFGCNCYHALLHLNSGLLRHIDRYTFNGELTCNGRIKSVVLLQLATFQSAQSAFESGELELLSVQASLTHEPPLHEGVFEFERLDRNAHIGLATEGVECARCGPVLARDIQLLRIEGDRSIVADKHLCLQYSGNQE